MLKTYGLSRLSFERLFETCAKVAVLLPVTSPPPLKDKNKLILSSVATWKRFLYEIKIMQRYVPLHSNGS